MFEATGEAALPLWRDWWISLGRVLTNARAWPCFANSHTLGWIAYATFLKDVGGVQYPADLDARVEQARRMFENAANAATGRG